MKLSHETIYGITLPTYCKKYGVEPNALIKITETEIKALEDRYCELSTIFKSDDNLIIDNREIDGVLIIELIRIVQGKRKSKMEKLIRQKAELGII